MAAFWLFFINFLIFRLVKNVRISVVASQGLAYFFQPASIELEFYPLFIFKCFFLFFKKLIVRLFHFHAMHIRKWLLSMVHLRYSLVRNDKIQLYFFLPTWFELFNARYKLYFIICKVGEHILYFCFVFCGIVHFFYMINHGPNVDVYWREEKKSKNL